MNKAEYDLTTNIRQSLLHYPDDWQLEGHQCMKHSKSGLVLDWTYGVKITQPITMELSVVNRARLTFALRSLSNKKGRVKKRLKQEKAARELLEKIEKYSTRDNKFVHEL